MPRPLQATFGEFVGDVLWCSIKRRDKSSAHGWRDLLSIKNLIVGPEYEGFEIHPAESRPSSRRTNARCSCFSTPSSDCVSASVRAKSREQTRPLRWVHDGVSSTRRSDRLAPFEMPDAAAGAAVR
jgi:hypothetical protein